MIHPLNLVHPVSLLVSLCFALFEAYSGLSGLHILRGGTREQQIANWVNWVEWVNGFLNMRPLGSTSDQTWTRPPERSALEE